MNCYSKMFYFVTVLSVLNVCMVGTSRSQNLSMFFPAVDIGENVDTFGNIYSTGPTSAIVEYPIDNPIAIQEDNKWIIYPGDLFNSRGFDGVD